MQQLHKRTDGCIATDGPLHTGYIFWSFKSKLQIIHVVTYIARFHSDSKKTVFNMFSIIFPYLSVPYFHWFIFVLPFSTNFSRRDTHSIFYIVWIDFITICIRFLYTIPYRKLQATYQNKNRNEEEELP